MTDRQRLKERERKKERKIERKKERKKDLFRIRTQKLLPFARTIGVAFPLQQLGIER